MPVQEYFGAAVADKRERKLITVSQKFYKPQKLFAGIFVEILNVVHDIVQGSIFQIGAVQTCTAQIDAAGIEKVVGAYLIEFC